MKKTVTYSVVGRVNPADRESGEVKYYACLLYTSPSPRD